MGSWIGRGAVLAVGLLAAACAARSDEASDGGDDAFSSGVATLLDFEFDGELTSTQSTYASGQIRGQMLFTVGHFNGEGGVARLDKLALSNVSVAGIGGGLYRVRYHAKLPVAWPSKTTWPSSYALTLPRRVDSSGTQSFLSKYGQTCNDGEGSSVDLANYWYHYRPHADGCALAANDVTISKASVKKSALNTSGKYPEYDRVWEDGALRVLAVFGKYAVGDTTEDDAGIAAYDGFVSAVRDALGPNATTSPAAIPDGPGVAAPDVTFELLRDDGRTVSVTVLLVDAVQSAPTSFVKRYAELVPGADAIIYSGHAGLGANVRALAKMGRFFPGKYQVFFMNGCDTLAYVDNAIGAAHAGVNPDDPNETKYMDVVTNAMPAYFSSMPDDSIALVNAMIGAVEGGAETYDQIFARVDPAQVVVVTGEEDNAYTPVVPMPAPPTILEETGTLTKGQSVSFTTDVLPVGTYVFQLTPQAGAPGGDADLRVRAGAAPTPAPSTTYKCPSYVANSDERCAITLNTPSRVYVSVTGDSLYTPASWDLRTFRR